MARSDRFERLFNRRVPLEKRMWMESLSAASTSGQELSYLIDAMQPIDGEFTAKAFAEAERVKAQIEANLASRYFVNFDFQGSVTSDTHIRVYSDIDLLVLHGAFVSLDPGSPNGSPYSGDVFEDLISLRRDSGRILKEKFPAARVDSSPGKSISIEGGSLQRKVDVVVGNWWHTQRYLQYRIKRFCGVRIIDTKGPTLILNLPFLHNYQINEKDKQSGGLRKTIRLLKTLKYDAEPDLQISSYDIAALAWNMSDVSLTVAPDAYVPLARNVRAELKRFIDNDQVRNSLMVPNGTRRIFENGGATIELLQGLYRELNDLIERVEYEESISLLRASRARSRNMPTWQERRPDVVVNHSF